MQCFHSADISLPVAIKIIRFEGPVTQPINPLEDDLFAFLGEPKQKIRDPDPHEVYVSLGLFAQGKPLIRELQVPKTHFGEWLTLPIKYRDLPASTQIVFTLWSCCSPRKCIAAAGTSFNLFNKKDVLRKGRHKLRLWSDREGDGSIESTTPGKITCKEDEGWRLEKLVQNFKQGNIKRVEWLDPITEKQIEERLQQQIQMPNCLPHMYIEFPSFGHPVIFYQKENPEAKPGPAVANSILFSKDKRSKGESELVVVHDPELTRENPVETKYLKLMRYNRGLLDKDLKPDSKERLQLMKILSYSITQQLTADDKEFLWKFRFYLSRNMPRALTKFMKCVDWSYRKDKKQAMKLIAEWASVEVDDALELLSSAFRGINPVRRYAIARLEKADDSELLSYLLQLVQALRYEKGFVSDSEFSSAEEVEARLSEETRRRGRTKKQGRRVSRQRFNARGNSQLEQFLIRRALQNPKLGNFLFWYLTVECPEEGKKKAYGQSYQATINQYISQLEQTEEGKQQLQHFENQKRLVKALVEMYNKIQNSPNKKREKRIEELKEMLEPYRKFEWGDIPLPLNPDIIITGVIPEKATIFSSAMAPFRITFSTQPYGPDEKTSFTVIFKCGDDLRQDQLIIQLISLMDTLLKKVQLDLKLTPYGVLATSGSDGFVEFVPSYPLGGILNKKVKAGKNKILHFLSEHHPEEKSYSEALTNFIKSIAGYCVITYILGVGDRHNDNLLIRESGNLFHIDFGYILGQEPPLKGFFPPPFKLTTQMVEAMGGEEGADYKKFQEYCWSAFQVLRKESNLILNLFSLMVDADIPGITVAGGYKSMLNLNEKFLLELSDEQAIVAFQELIKSSVGNVLLPFIDYFHDESQKRK